MISKKMIKPQDYIARQQALCVEHSFIIKAPAGSGKTTLLVKRYLCLLTTVKHPEEIIAITFTRKSASEMVERVLSALMIVYTQEKSTTHDEELYQIASLALEQDKRQDWNIIQNPSRIRIQTIDALSQHLVRQMPWSAGFGAAPTSIADDVKQLYLTAARQSMMAALSDQKLKSQAQNLLLSLDNNYSKTCNLLVGMLARRDQWQALLVQHLEKDNARIWLEQNWRYSVKKILFALDAKLNLLWKESLLECARYAGEKLSKKNPKPSICQFVNTSQFPQTEIEQLEQWKIICSFLLTAKGVLRKKVNATMGFPTKKDDGNEAIKEKFELLLQDLSDNGIGPEIFAVSILPEAAFSDKEWQTLNALVEILKHTVAQLTLVFQKQGTCDHIEIAARANLALGDVLAPSDLSLQLDYKIQHLLVDEFQDTSHTQMELFRRLTAGWQPDEGRTVFFVGDPMQSIYRFREADVGIFLNVYKHGFEPLQIQALELTENFRSSCAVVDWINRSFETIFPKKDDLQSGAVQYARSSAHPMRIDSNDGVMVHVTEKSTEAQDVCELISELISQAGSEQTIAVLVRSRSHLKYIVSLLQKSHITYQGLKIDRLLKRGCIQDILALTRALTHLGDRLSWLAVLRAPWCGIDLKDLTHIARQCDKKTIWQTIQHLPLCLSAESNVRIQRIVCILRPALDKVGRQPVHHLVAHTWQALGGQDTIDKSDLVNIKLYLHLLSEIQCAGQIKDSAELDRALDDLWASSDELGTQLRLMTIHNAKGLEFDYVILPGLYKKTATDETQLLIWNECQLENGETSLLVSPIKIGEDENRRYDFIKAFDDKSKKEENRRLLYVACTRAKKQLHLCVSHKVEASSLQSLLLPVVGPELDKQQPVALVQAQEHPESIIYRRLASDYRPQSLDQNLTSSAKHNLADSIVEYQWVGVSARHIGTLIHKIIHDIAQTNTKRVFEDPSNWRNRLSSLGVDENQLEAGISNIEIAIENMYSDPKAKWILSEKHNQQNNEWALTCQLNGNLENIIIDRTFIDEQDRRWIIDYKTSTHIGGNIEAFFDAEVGRYKFQLEKYARIVRLNESAPICLGLYFPLLKGWREWNYAG